MLQMAAHVRRVLCSALPRLWWGLLILVHLPVFVAVWSSIVLGGFDISRLGSAVALTAAIGFFLLKFRDVAYLRFRSRGHSFIAVCLLTAIAHHGVVTSNVDQSAIVPTTAVAVTTVAAAGLVRRRRSLLQGWGRLIASLAASPQLAPVAVRADRCVPATARRMIVITSSTPRAPPA